MNEKVGFFERDQYTKRADKVVEHQAGPHQTKMGRSMELAKDPVAQVVRVCTTCNDAKPETEEFFYVQVDKTKGVTYRFFMGRCKECTRAKDRAYRASIRPKPTEKPQIFIMALTPAGDQVRACSTCEEVKTLSSAFFYVDKTNPFGLMARCSLCVRANTNRIYTEDKESVLAKQKEYYERTKHDEKKRARMTAYSAAYQRAYPEKNAAKTARWRERNPEKARESNYRSMKRRLEEDPEFRMHFKFGLKIRKAFRKRGLGGSLGKSWVDVVGYDAADLMRHLERQFTKGMTWDNYGEWHVDHIQPQSSFHFDSTDSPEFKACWALSNLRPLWGKENMSKHAKRLFLL